MPSKSVNKTAPEIIIENSRENPAVSRRARPLDGALSAFMMFRTPPKTPTPIPDNFNTFILKSQASLLLGFNLFG